eukprot:6413657-Amphidinium_carterae.3
MLANDGLEPLVSFCKPLPFAYRFHRGSHDLTLHHSVNTCYHPTFAPLCMGLPFGLEHTPISSRIAFTLDQLRTLAIHLYEATLSPNLLVLARFNRYSRRNCSSSVWLNLKSSGGCMESGVMEL